MDEFTQEDITSKKVTAVPKQSKMQSLIRKQVLKTLTSIKGGCLVIHDSIETVVCGQEQSVNGEDNYIKVIVTVSDLDFYRQIAMQGSIGAADSYMQSQWHADNLTNLVRLLVINRDILDGMEGGLAWLKNSVLNIWHYFNKNNLAGSKKNIAAHYDLGNQFFKLFLDQHLMYSSAIFTEEANTLELASDLKLKTICEKLDLKKEDHLLEIGTGWGGLAIYAATNYGCKVTTTTISEQQYLYAKQRVKELNLEDKITLFKKDYRLLEGEYDKLVSIEMIEAVGHHYLETYLKKCSSLIKDDGLALIQAITIEDSRYKQALKSVDFIKRYIFPGSFIPCVSVIVNQAAKISDMRLLNLEDFGDSYAKTLDVWCQRFLTNLDAVREQDFSEAFIKMWEFYLRYCEGGFIEKAISDVHLLFAKPKNKRQQWLALEQ